jgi:hypothetical protein
MPATHYWRYSILAFRIGEARSQFFLNEDFCDEHTIRATVANLFENHGPEIPVDEAYAMLKDLEARFGRV